MRTTTMGGNMGGIKTPASAAPQDEYDKGQIIWVVSPIVFI